MAEAPTPPFVAAEGFTPGGNKPIHRIVIHGTVSGTYCGGADAIAKYFQNPSRASSAHYIVDPCSVRQCVHDWDVAWHAPPNKHSLGIEMCDPVEGPDSRWDDDEHQQMMRRTAELARQLAGAYDVPLVWLEPDDLRAGKHGITDHDSVSRAWGQSSHWDPNWTVHRKRQFMAMATGQAVPTTPSETGPGEPYRPVLRSGSTGSAVRELQGMLGVTVDGDFGPDTERAVQTFQASHSLTVDGIVGPATWAELDAQQSAPRDPTNGHNIGGGVSAYLAGPEGARVGAAVGDEHRWDSGNSWTATEHGMVIWRAGPGKAWGVARGIYAAWSETGRENGGWGLPTSDEHAQNGMAWQWFDERLVTWSPDEGVHTVGLGLGGAWVKHGGSALGAFRYDEEWNPAHEWWYAGVATGHQILRHYLDRTRELAKR